MLPASQHKRLSSDVQLLRHPLHGKPAEAAEGLQQGRDPPPCATRQQYVPRPQRADSTTSASVLLTPRRLACTRQAAAAAAGRVAAGADFARQARREEEGAVPRASGNIVAIFVNFTMRMSY